MMKTMICLVLAVGLGAGSIADASPSAPTWGVDLEILDQARGDRPRLAVHLTLDEHGCASASFHHEDFDDDVKFCHEGGDRDAPAIAFDIEQKDRKEKASSARHFRFRSRVAANGKRAVVGRFEANGDHEIEVAATVTAR